MARSTDSVDTYGYSSRVTKVLPVDGDGNKIDVQNPLPTDGDSVYAKDIWVDESTFTDWSGDITDLFDNLHSQNINTTSDNPKTIVVHFNRTIIGNAVGLGNTGSGDFSNVKIQIRNSGAVDTTVIDESASNTKYTTRTFQLPVTAGFNALVITFHTTDTISLSNCVILKTHSVVSRGQAVKPDGTVVDLNATTAGNPKFSLEEFDETFYTSPLPIMKGFDIPKYDDIVMSYTGTDLTGVVYKLATVVVATLTLTYTSGNLTRVVHT